MSPWQLKQQQLMIAGPLYIDSMICHPERFFLLFGHIIQGNIREQNFGSRIDDRWPKTASKPFCIVVVVLERQQDPAVLTWPARTNEHYSVVATPSQSRSDGGLVRTVWFSSFFVDGSWDISRFHAMLVDNSVVRRVTSSVCFYKQEAQSLHVFLSWRYTNHDLY